VDLYWDPGTWRVGIYLKATKRAKAQLAQDR